MRDEQRRGRTRRTPAIAGAGILDRLQAPRLWRVAVVLRIGLGVALAPLAAPEARAQLCNRNFDCDDGNPCTNDVCSVIGVCSNDPEPEGTSCEDGLFCTDGDICRNGECLAGSNDPCVGPDGDTDCSESCDESANACTGDDPAGTCDGVLWSDNFDADIGPDIPSDQNWQRWGETAEVSTVCGRSSGNAFYFEDVHNPCNCRGLATDEVDVPFGGTVRFWLGTRCVGAAVVRLEYSLDGGSSWTQLDSWAGYNRDFKTVSIPVAAQSNATRFRWVSYGGLNNNDTWAIDDVTVTRCGDGVLDSGEVCEDGECCDLGTCTWADVGSSCGDTADTECNAADTCDGAGGCLANLAAAGAACGDQGVDCHVDDSCDGAGNCADAGFASVGASCGDGSDTECSDPDTCDGAGSCLANHASSGASCGDGSDTECNDADTCDGTGACLANHAAAGAACGDQGVACLLDDSCDGAGSCADAGFETAGTSCGDGSDTECTDPDTCNGAGACLDNHASSGATCGDGSDTECTDPDTCDGAGVCLDNHASSGATCGDDSVTECTDADTCDGAGACLDNHAAAGVVCGDPSDGECTAADSCDGAGFCDPNHADAGTTCGDPTDDVCSAADSCDGSGVCDANDVEPQPDECTGLDHYVVYKAKASSLSTRSIGNELPEGWNVQLDDAILENLPADDYPDDPENYRVVKARGIVNPAVPNAEGTLARPGLNYVRYLIRRARDGAGSARENGSYPRAEKAPKREWTISNDLGELVLQTRTLSALWVPAGQEEAPGSAATPEDATHYLCYKAKAAKTPSSADGQNPESPPGSGRARFLDDLEVHFADDFDDCALLRDGSRGDDRYLGVRPCRSRHAQCRQSQAGRRQTAYAQPPFDQIWAWHGTCFPLQWRLISQPSIEVAVLRCSTEDPYWRGTLRYRSRCVV